MDYNLAIVGQRAGIAMIEIGIGQLIVWAVLIAGAVAGVWINTSKGGKVFAWTCVVAAAAFLAAPQAMEICAKVPALCLSLPEAGKTRAETATPPAPTIVHKVERIIERERIIEVPLPSDARRDEREQSNELLRRVVGASGRPTNLGRADEFSSAPAAEAKIMPRKQVAVAPGRPTPSLEPTPVPYVQDIRQELIRLNCLQPSTDTTWGKDVVSAINRFNMRGYRRISDQPDASSLSVLREFRDPIC